MREVEQTGEEPDTHDQTISDQEEVQQEIAEVEIEASVEESKHEHPISKGTIAESAASDLIVSINKRMQSNPTIQEIMRPINVLLPGNTKWDRTQKWKSQLR